MSETCGVVQYNYWLWMLETSSRLWCRAGGPYVCCCLPCWISNKYTRVRNCPLVGFLLTVHRLVLVPYLGLTWVLMYFVASLPQFMRLTPGWGISQKWWEIRHHGVMSEPRGMVWLGSFGCTWLPRIGHFAEIHWWDLWATGTPKELLPFRNPRKHYSYMYLEAANYY